MLIKSPLFDIIFKWSGWRLEGQVPSQLRKSITIVCPHATWKDFPVGLGARSLMNIPIFFGVKRVV